MNLMTAILVMAVFTYLVRVLPMLIFKKPIESTFVKSFLHYIPYAILASMTVPYIFYGTGHLVSGLAGTLVAVIFALQKRSLITVSLLAVVAAYIVELLIAFGL